MSMTTIKHKLDKKNDFKGFGAYISENTHSYEVRVVGDKVQLVEDYSLFSDREEEVRSVIPLDLWNTVSGLVARDFNARLKEKGYQPGKFKNYGTVSIDRLLGRELALLFWALEGLSVDDYEKQCSAYRAWQALRPEERWFMSSQAQAFGAALASDTDKGYRHAIRMMFTMGSKTLSNA